MTNKVPVVREPVAWRAKQESDSFPWGFTARKEVVDLWKDILGIDAEPLFTEDKTEYKVGPLTFEKVFKENDIKNLSDMQAVLDAVEKALSNISNP